MFSLEERIRARSPENKVRWRRRYIKALLDKLHAWLTEQLDACPKGSALYKAISYPLKPKTWASLVRFLEDCRVPMENNRGERAIRPVVMGRANGLFAGSLAAGGRVVQIMGLLETAKMNGLEPHAWLTDVLKRLPSWTEARLDELLPLAAYRLSEEGGLPEACRRVLLTGHRDRGEAILHRASAGVSTCIPSPPLTQSVLRHLRQIPDSVLQRLTQYLL